MTTTLDQPARMQRRLYDFDAGRTFATRSGVKVRSKIEKIIADFLLDEGIQFVYEPELRIEGRTFRPDFYLPEYGVYYEHFGRSDDAYQESVERKMALYRQAGVSLIYTRAANEENIEEAILNELRNQR